MEFDQYNSHIYVNSRPVLAAERRFIVKEILKRREALIDDNRSRRPDANLRRRKAFEEIHHAVFIKFERRITDNQLKKLIVRAGGGSKPRESTSSLQFAEPLANDGPNNKQEMADEEEVSLVQPEEDAGEYGTTSSYDSGAYSIPRDGFREDSTSSYEAALQRSLRTTSNSTLSQALGAGRDNQEEIPRSRLHNAPSHYSSTEREIRGLREARRSSDSNDRHFEMPPYSSCSFNRRLSSRDETGRYGLLLDERLIETQIAAFEEMNRTMRDVSVMVRATTNMVESVTNFLQSQQHLQRRQQYSNPENVPNPRPLPRPTDNGDSEQKVHTL